MAPMTSVSVASSELAEVETRDPFVIVGVVVVGRGMVPFADFQERIVERSKVAGEQQRCDTSLVRLESDGDDVTHEARVFAKVFRQAVRGPVHRKDGTVLLLR